MGWENHGKTDGKTSGKMSRDGKIMGFINDFLMGKNLFTNTIGEESLMGKSFSQWLIFWVRVRYIEI